MIRERNQRALNDKTERRRVPAKKNTRRWCRGVVGREHAKRWTIKNSTWSNSSIEVCTNCKREFRWCWHGAWYKGRCICGAQGARTA